MGVFVRKRIRQQNDEAVVVSEEVVFKAIEKHFNNPEKMIALIKTPEIYNDLTIHGTFRRWLWAGNYGFRWVSNDAAQSRSTRHCSTTSSDP